MKKIKLSVFEIFALLFVDTALFFLAMAFLGVFYLLISIAYFIILIGLTSFVIKKKYVQISRWEKIDCWVFGTLFVLGIIFSIFTTPTIFGGRDEGSLSTAGILLSKNHSLKYTDSSVQEFFNIYGYGKALNFPGFYYEKNGELRTQFLPALPAWFAGCYQFFGLTGIRFANLIPFLVFIFSFYLVSKRFIKNKEWAIASTVFLVTTFPIFIFFKFTLSEIFFGAFLWLGIHFLLRYLENKNYQNYFLIFIPFAITPFLRIESVAIIFMLVLTLIFADHKNIKKPKYQLLFAVIGIIFVLSFLTNARFFSDTIRGFVELPNNTEQSSGTTIGDEDFSFIPDEWRKFYLPQVFLTYNVLPIVIIGLLGIALLLKKKKWRELIPVFVFSPVMIYLIDANISLDHPWMFRRFVFALIPIFILYSFVIFEKISKKYKLVSRLVVILLFLFNISLLAPLLFFSQNKNLLSQIENIESALQLTEKDLVLVSQKATGSGWSMMTEPLRAIHEKQTVYFMTPPDFEKIDKTKFERIFLISSEKEINLYEDIIAKKDLAGIYEIENKIITPSRKPLEKPKVDKQKTRVLILRLQ